MAIGDKCKDCGVELTEGNYVKHSHLCRSCSNLHKLDAFHKRLERDRQSTSIRMCVGCKLLFPENIYEGRSRCPTCMSSMSRAARPGLPSTKLMIKINSMVETLLSTSSCSKCGENNINVLDFHHIDPSTKLFAIGTARSKSGYSEDDVLNEITKCSILCCNCHMLEQIKRPKSEDKRTGVKTILEYLISNSLKCSTCSESNMDLLMFHHRDPSTKIGGICQMKSNVSKATLIAEMDKCDIMCHNCHRKLHAEIRSKESAK